MLYKSFTYLLTYLLTSTIANNSVSSFHIIHRRLWLGLGLVVAVMSLDSFQNTGVRDSRIATCCLLYAFVYIRFVFV